MAARTYQNFDLLVEAEPDGVFQVRVTSCPLGESPSARFHLPWEPTQLENLLLKLDPGRSGTRRVAGDPQVQATIDLGGPLFESVFPEDVMLSWTRSLDAAAAKGDGLRLRLRLADAPTLAGLPWELLYDRRTNCFLAQSEKTPVVRYLDVRQPPRPLVVNGALRILMIISSPTDLPELDVEAEWVKVHDALGPKIDQGLVVLDRLPAATIPDLATWLRRHDVHVLHFVGHGDYDERLQDGVLFFTDRYGRSARVTPSILGPHVRDHDPLRLVLLNACQSARVDTLDPFSGMAQGLVQQDATAVVAMQFPISDGAAVTFTGEFYGSLADGLPVDQSVTSARKALLAGYEAEWATPVLFLRAPDGRVFEHIVAEPVVAEPVVAEPVEEPPVEAPAQPVHSPEPDPVAQPVAYTQPIPLSGPLAPPTPPITRQPEPTAAIWSRQTHAVVPLQTVPPTHRKRSRSKWVLVVVGTVVVIVVALGIYGMNLPDETVAAGALAGEVRSGTDVVAFETASPPVIDGNAAEWVSTAAFTSDKVIAPKGATASVSAKWALKWDQQALYVFVVVKDPVVTQTHEAQPSQLFNGDSIGFEFGPPGITRTDVLQPTDVHVLIGPTQTGAVVGAINVAKGAVFTAGPKLDGANGAVGSIPGGYTIEAAIPWSLLHLSGVTVGQTFGMNLNVSDAVADGTARGSLRDMVSNNPKRTTNNASTRAAWGRLTLQ
ncbi:MAG: CHAT domain-containing protein [Lapillicoccus sp.]